MKNNFIRKICESQIEIFEIKFRVSLNLPNILLGERNFKIKNDIFEITSSNDTARFEGFNIINLFLLFSNCIF